MQVPDNWDRDQSPFRAVQLIETKLGVLETTFSNIKTSCDQRCCELDEMISSAIRNRNDFDSRSTQWEQQCETFISEVDATLAELSSSDAQQEDLSEEEKNLLMGSEQDGIHGIDFYIKQQQKEEETSEEQ